MCLLSSFMFGGLVYEVTILRDLLMRYYKLNKNRANFVHMLPKYYFIKGSNIIFHFKQMRCLVLTHNTYDWYDSILRIEIFDMLFYGV